MRTKNPSVKRRPEPLDEARPYAIQTNVEEWNDAIESRLPVADPRTSPMRMGSYP